jgi:hypothetical protein
MDRRAPGISNPQRTAGFHERTNDGSFPAFSRFYDFLNFFFSRSVSRAAGSESGNHQPDSCIYLYNWSDNRKRTDPVSKKKKKQPNTGNNKV